jgi:hypothetical protein
VKFIFYESEIQKNTKRNKKKRLSLHKNWFRRNKQKKSKKFSLQPLTLIRLFSSSFRYFSDHNKLNFIHHISLEKERIMKMKINDLQEKQRKQSNEELRDEKNISHDMIL